MVKQVICVRTDLNMRKGKMCAQVAHASMKVFMDKMVVGEVYNGKGEAITGFFNAQIPNITEAMKEWIEGHFTKVVLGIKGEDVIFDIAKKAKAADIPFAIMIDNGFTEFHGNRTITAIAIGPDESEKIDVITGKMKLI